MTSFICQKITFWGFGALFLILGGIASGIWPILFNQKLRTKLALSKESESFNLWRETPIPMYIDFYMFHWTNPKETLTKNEVPNFVEKGPYVFREEHQKVILGWNDNGTVTFKQIRKWMFVPELSSGSLSDKITNVNVIAMTIGNYIKKYEAPLTLNMRPIINKIINAFLKTVEANVYTTATVGELLFSGYDDPFLKLASKLSSIIKIKIPMDRFGWFYNRNMSADYDGVFNMMTGENTLDNLGLLKMWNYNSRTNFFPGDCGIVEGTTGELWPVDTPQKSKATIFATDLCSKIDLDWEDETSIHGASGVIFEGRSRVFDNTTSCYCIGTCHPTGVREISTCRFGAPAFISFPHFYQADSVFRKMVSGMEPSEKNHTFDLTLHKITGIPLSVNARLQINVLVDKIEGIDFYEHLPRAYMPMIWFNQRAAITPELAKQLSDIQIFGYLEPCFFAVAGLGAILLIIGLFLWSSGKWKRSTMSRPLLQDPTS
ncbi:protein croquemort [Halyomorpha halys]|uniref:protein croquemort n=1 Tax=Halyomorpha halys TaxID=286706 RepID=UPI0034D2E251